MFPGYGMSNATEVDCPVCNGEGTIYGPIEATVSDSSRPCHECGGDGVLTLSQLREYDDWQEARNFI